MKKLLISVIGVMAICAAFAAGENVATSKAFVDTGVAQKQEKIPANDGVAQVLTNTGTAGQVGTKDIYDSTGAYTEQTDALVTAGQFNTAVQNAIDTEFECVAWRDPNDHTSDCMLVQIRGVTEDSILPTGYTALEYIESTGTQKINTGVSGLDTGVWKIYVKWMITGVPAYDWPTICGTYDDENTNTYRIIGVRSNTSSYLMYGNSKAGGGGASMQGAMNQIHTGIIENGLVTFDGSEYTCTLQGHTIPATSDIYLFDRMVGRIYHSYATKDGVYKYNIIPARRDSDGELGMYDTVSNTFFTNAGTGEFIAGPDANNQYLPSGQ